MDCTQHCICGTSNPKPPNLCKPYFGFLAGTAHAEKVPNADLGAPTPPTPASACSGSSGSKTEIPEEPKAEVATPPAQDGSGSKLKTPFIFIVQCLMISNYHIKAGTSTSLSDDGSSCGHYSFS